MNKDKFEGVDWGYLLLWFAAWARDLEHGFRELWRPEKGREIDYDQVVISVHYRQVLTDFRRKKDAVTYRAMVVSLWNPGLGSDKGVKGNWKALFPSAYSLPAIEEEEHTVNTTVTDMLDMGLIDVHQAPLIDDYDQDAEVPSSSYPSEDGGGGAGAVPSSSAADFSESASSSSANFSEAASAAPIHILSPTPSIGSFGYGPVGFGFGPSVW
jgi:hypothetical protein